jgi:UDP-N-acetyl-D-glucosamine dehydrogenase
LPARKHKRGRKARDTQSREIILRADLENRLREKTSLRSAVVTIIGLGHVGLPLIAAFSKARYHTIGVDNDEERLASLRLEGLGGKDDVDNQEIVKLIRGGKIQLTNQIMDAVKKSDFVAICVPTPVDRRNIPDISIISDVLKTIGRCLTPGQVVIVESTVYPGFTDKVARSLLELSGLKCGIDFSLAYSPERIDPGNRKYSVTMIPKIIGGVDKFGGEIAMLLYQSVIHARVFRVSDATTAECTKMLENVYRFVNIALVNELALLCERIGVNIFEVISAASSKPFGFSPHLPGPGIGGPCVPKDPLYLQYAARKAGLHLNLVEAGVKVNGTMPGTITSNLERKLKMLRRKRPKIAVLGLAYKPESSGTINSPAIEIISRLKSFGTELSLYDPYVRSIEVDGRALTSESSAEAASAAADCLLFLVDHEMFKKLDLRELKTAAADKCILFDAKNIFKAEDVEAIGFRYIGLGKPQTKLLRVRRERDRH